MGVVLEVKNVLIDKGFALKLLDLQGESSAALPRFQREAKLLLGLEHPNMALCREGSKLWGSLLV